MLLLKLVASIVAMVGFLIMTPAILLMIDHSKPTTLPISTPERRFFIILVFLCRFCRESTEIYYSADTGFYNSRNWFKCSYADNEPRDKSAIPRRKGRLSRAADKSAIAAGSAMKFALLTPFILASNIKSKVDDIKQYK